MTNYESPIVEIFWWLISTHPKTASLLYYKIIGIYDKDHPLEIHIFYIKRLSNTRKHKAMKKYVPSLDYNWSFSPWHSSDYPKSASLAVPSSINKLNFVLEFLNIRGFYDNKAPKGSLWRSAAPCLQRVALCFQALSRKNSGHHFH